MSKLDIKVLTLLAKSSQLINSVYTHFRHRTMGQATLPIEVTIYSITPLEEIPNSFISLPGSAISKPDKLSVYSALTNRAAQYSPMSSTTVANSLMFPGTVSLLETQASQ